MTLRPLRLSSISFSALCLQSAISTRANVVDDKKIYEGLKTKAYAMSFTQCASTLERKAFYDKHMDVSAEL